MKRNVKIRTLAVKDLRSDTIFLQIIGPKGSPRPNEFLSPDDARKLAADLLAAADSAEYRCTACGREESECSANPCDAVKKDRES